MEVLNKSVPQLTVTLWSGQYFAFIRHVKKVNTSLFHIGLAMGCQIIGENLDCTLTLPEKFRSHIEGLAGNFNGNYSDDLFNRKTNQTISISIATDQTSLNNDTNVLTACRSCKFILKIQYK
jgi:hypothetical protein